MKEELKKKLLKILELNRIIQLNNSKLLTREQKGKIDEQQDRLEYRLKELVGESKLKEAELKIVAFTKVVEILKN